MEFDTAVDNLLDAAATDYAQWRARGDYSSANDFDDFRNNIYRDGGRKYLRITKSQGGQQCVWGFVVLADGPKFKCGDILKAASWASPATNKARGNIFEEYDVRWTGPNYL